MRILKTLIATTAAAAMVAAAAPEAAAQDAARTVVLRFHKQGDSTVAIRGGTVTIDHVMEVGNTDADGKVQVPDLDDGGHIVELVTKGYQAFFDNFTSGPRSPNPIQFGVLAIEVAAKPKGVATGLALAGFEKRRTAAQGKFFTIAQLKAAEGRPLANLLKVDGGASIVSGAKGESLVALAGQASCLAGVVRDGLRVYPFEGATPPDLDRIFTDDLAGIEYYAKPAAVPAELKDAATCGALVLWSR